MRRLAGKIGVYGWAGLAGKAAPILSAVQLWVTRHGASLRAALLIAMCAVVTALSFVATLFVLG
jgi:hypothetical protein